MTLGEHIISLRAQKGWSQGDLADALDVSRQSVSKWETDSSVPELEKLLKLADLFGVTLDALVRGEDTSEPQPIPVGFSSQPVPHAPKHHKKAGIVLLCIGAALFLIFLLLTGSLAGLIFAVPFLVCSVICFVSTGRRTVLWCMWALYLYADLYLRYATGLSWSTIKLTHLWTPEMNYTRLFIAWGQFLAMLALIGATLFSYRRLTLEVTKKRLLWLLFGWVAALVLLPLLMEQLILPPLRQLPLDASFSLAFPLSILYSYLRLALITFLSSRSLAVFRAWRAEKRAQ